MKAQLILLFWMLIATAQAGAQWPPIGRLSPEDTDFYYTMHPARNPGRATLDDARRAFESGYEYLKKRMYREAAAMIGLGNGIDPNNLLGKFYGAKVDAEWYLSDPEGFARLRGTSWNADQSLGAIMHRFKDVIPDGSDVSPTNRTEAKQLCARIYDAWYKATPTADAYDIKFKRAYCGLPVAAPAR